MDKPEKVIVKSEPWRRINYTYSDLYAVNTVPVKRTVVTQLMTKVHLITYLGTKERLNDGDVIRVGNLGICYRVKKHHKVSDVGGNIYVLKRMDGAFVTSLDINAIKLGDVVEILNRESFEQLFNKAYNAGY